MTEFPLRLELVLALFDADECDDGRRRRNRHRIAPDSPSPIAERYSRIIGMPNRA